MIVFQVKGQSHRLSTLNGKEKDVIKKFFTYSTKYHRRHRGARKKAKPRKIKARSSRPCMNCSLYRCAYDVHNYDAQQHRAGQIISTLTLQTITIAQMLSVGAGGEIYNCRFSITYSRTRTLRMLWKSRCSVCCIRAISSSSFSSLCVLNLYARKASR